MRTKCTTRAAWGVGASALALLLVRVPFALRRRAAARIDDGLQDRLAAAQSAGTAWRTWGVPLRVALRFVLGLGVWVLVVLVLDAWLTFVPHPFAYTRPWGGRSMAWRVGVAGPFVQAIAQAVPGLVIAGLIFAIARLVARGGTLLLRRVERGQVHLSWLDADIAAPTGACSAPGSGCSRWPWPTPTCRARAARPSRGSRCWPA